MFQFKSEGRKINIKKKQQKQNKHTIITRKTDIPAQGRGNSL